MLSKDKERAAPAPRGERAQLGTEPYFFSTPEGPLYGCYHAERGAGRGEFAVVLCPPAGEQLVRAHRTFRHLASRLAAGGVPALRFDYFGCGDSPGDHEQASLDLWLANVRGAVAEARRRSRRPRVGLVGYAMGATLAALAASDRVNADGLVLWDAVLSGRRHLSELAGLQTELETSLLGRPAPEHPDGFVELLGYRYSPAMVRELELVDLGSLARSSAKRAFVLDTGSSGDSAPVASRLEALGVEIKYLYAPDVRIALGGLYQAELPTKAVRAVSSWVLGGRA